MKAFGTEIIYGDDYDNELPTGDRRLHWDDESGALNLCEIEGSMPKSVELNRGTEDFAGVMMNILKQDDASLKSLLVVPSKYKDAWNHEDPASREKWREAIKTELGRRSRNRRFPKVGDLLSPSGYLTSRETVDTRQDWWRVVIHKFLKWTLTKPIAR